VGKLGGAKSAHSRLRALSQLVILACESRRKNAERLWVSDGQENELCARECAPTVSKIIGRGGMQNYPRFLAPSAASPRAAESNNLTEAHWIELGFLVTSLSATAPTRSSSARSGLVTLVACQQGALLRVEGSLQLYPWRLLRPARYCVASLNLRHSFHLLG